MVTKQKTSTMKAILFDSFGESDQLKMEDIETPQPKAGEIQIQVVYAAVNPVDWKIRLGLLKDRILHHFPIIPGWDAAGIVSAVGENVDRFNNGDAVFAYCRKPVVQWGTYAEYVCIEADKAALKPTNLSFAQAAAIPLAGLTAWQALFDEAKLKKGDTILIHGGSGGVGSLAVQLAKIAGAFVITTASESNHAYVKHLGADIAIDYRTQSIEEEVKNIFPNGIDIVFDLLGKETYEDSFPLLKPGGCIVSLIEQPNEALEKKYEVKALYVFVKPNGKELEQIAQLIEEGKMTPIPVQKMPLYKAAEAQETSRQGHTQGKIVLKIQEEIAE